MDRTSAKALPLQLIEDLLKNHSSTMSVPFKQLSVGNRDMPASISYAIHANGDFIPLHRQKHTFLAIIRNEKAAALTIKEIASDGKRSSISMGISFSAAILNIESYEDTLPGRKIVITINFSSATPPLLIDLSDWKANENPKKRLLLWKFDASSIRKIRIIVDDITPLGKIWDDREVKWFLTRKTSPYSLAPVVLPSPLTVRSSSPPVTKSNTAAANSSVPPSGSETPLPAITVIPDPKPAALLASARRALRVAKDTLADLQEDLQGEVVVNFNEAFAKARAGVVGKEGEEEGIEERVLRYDMAQRKLFRVTAAVQKEQLYREVVVPGLEGRVAKWEGKVKKEEKASEALIEL